MSKSTADQKHRIQMLFLHPAESYRLTEASRLIGISPGALRREAEVDQREAYRSNGSWCFSWRQVALIAMRRWTLAEIHEALGAEAAKVLPPLLSLHTLRIRLPEYLVRALETAAAEDATTLDEFLHRELLGFAGTMVDQLEAFHPGFRPAYLFPGEG